MVTTFHGKSTVIFKNSHFSPSGFSLLHLESTAFSSFPFSPTVELARNLGVAIQSQADIASLIQKLDNIHQAVALLGQVHHDVAETAIAISREICVRVVALFISEVCL